MNQKNYIMHLFLKKFMKLIKSNQQHSELRNSTLKSCNCKPKINQYIIFTEDLIRVERKIDNVKCHAVFAYDNYESVEEINEKLFYI